MASKSMLCHSNDESWSMSSVSTALLEVVLACLLFLSVCISVTISAIIRFFHLSPPCFCAKPHVGLSWNARKQDNSEGLLCDYHANKLFLLKTLILNRGCAPVHSLCEDCMLLNCSSTETDAYVNSNPELKNKDFKCTTLIHVNNCQICLSKRQKCYSPSAFNEAITDEGSGGLQGEVGSDSGSSDSFIPDRSKQPMTYLHSRCSCCKELIREKLLGNEFVRKKSAKVFVEDLEEQFWKSAPMPFCETEECEFLGEESLMNYAKKDKSQEPDMLGDDSRLEETGLEGKVQRQKYGLDSKFCSDRLLEEGEAVGSELPQILSERCATIETYPVNEYTVPAPLPCVDVEPRVHLQPSDNDVIKELKDALEAEREAHSTLYTELEAERNASAIAANETMAMMSRLQEEKAAIQMETRQFKRMAEEKAVFDQEAIALLKDILCKREEEKFALEKEVELYRSDHRIRKLRRQRRKREELEQPHDKQRVNEKRVLLLEERKDKKIIKESQELQGPFEHNGCSAIDLTWNGSLTDSASKMKRFEDSEAWETRNKTGSHFRRRHDDLLPSTKGENVLIAFDAVGTKFEQEDYPSLICGQQKSKDKDVYSEVNLQKASLALDEAVCKQKLAGSPGISDDEGSSEQSFMMEHEGKSKQEADKVEDHAYDPWRPACSTELQQVGKIGAENLASSSMHTMETLSQDTPNLNSNENGLEGTALEDSITMLGPYSQRGQECWANSKNITGNGDGCQESGHYNTELVEDFITIEVEPMNMNSKLKQESTETMNHKQAVDFRATPSTFVQYEIGDELFELPSDLNFSEKLHQEPDSACNTAISSLEQSLSQVDKQARERESKNSNFCKNFPPFNLPEERDVLQDNLHDTRNDLQASDKTPKREQRGTIRESEQNKDFFDPSNSLAGFDEWTSDDAFDQDSLCSADEYLPEFSGCDIRTTSMIRRDYQRKAVEEEVRQLTSRLQVLEDDRDIMKNIMETLRSENGEIRLLHDIAQQLQQLHGFEKKLDNLKELFEAREPSAVSEDLKNVPKKWRC
ncbi:hypothetical protein O6H91_01G017000 [Diphasiastrum complanatum]|uniref:Uncharacterized protein n=1 Tax=Diphasiastrum complanatum TaxID=34168 RepID=A0ACC2ENQ1_DIPCM|nr:hypothetical protein O6H91_01G017000 [Diphasiastrum complanatum]